MRILVVLFFLFLALPGKSETCSYDIIFPFAEVILGDEQVHCNHAGEVAQVIRDINRLTPNMEKPGDIKLSLLWKSNIAFFNPLEPLILLPYRYVSKGLNKHPHYTFTIWAHEYGHAFFLMAMEKRTEFWNAMLSYRGKKSKLREKLDFNLEAYHTIVRKIRELDPEKDADLIKKLEKEKESQEAIVEELRLNALNVDHVYKKLRAFVLQIFGHNELFADIVATVYVKDFRAVYKTLAFVGYNFIEDGKDMLKKAVYRDFTNRKNKLKRWRPDRSVHSIMAPTRYYIWNRYLKNGLYNRFPELTIKIVLNAAVNEANKLWEISKQRILDPKNEKWQDPKIFELDILNIRFMNSLDREFRRIGRH